MRKIILALAILTTMLVSACGFIDLSRVRGSGDLVMEERNVSGFSKIDLTCSGDVVLTQGDKDSLTIEGEDNILEYVTSEVRGDTLVLGTKPNVNLVFSKHLTFYVTMKDVSGIEISGSGSVNSESVETEDLDLSIGGSGDIKLDEVDADQLSISIGGSGDVKIDVLAAESVKTDIGGSGDVFLTGKVQTQDLLISGSGKYKTVDLSSETAEIRISGSGTAEIWVLESLDAHISGSGDIRYYGRPMIDQTTSGSGDILSLGEK